MTRIDISAAVFDAVDRGEPITILGRRYIPAPEPASILCGCGYYTFSRNFHTVTVNGMTHRPGQPCYDVSHP